ncbi:MAG: ribonuclease HII [Rhodospirillales bacterium]
MPDLALERVRWDAGAARVCGIDEAGRGPLAGPVVAAAVVLNPDALDKPVWEMLDDSKRMSTATRDTLYKTIMANADVGVGIAGVDEIDLLNVLGATLKAMTDAVRELESAPDFALIDGNQLPALTCDGECVVRGDGKSLSIAAASVIAKVTRDRIMAALSREHPGYGWERNAGYGTEEHLAAIASLGVTPHHRRSFAPVREALNAAM